jgi:hypothetical protein
VTQLVQEASKKAFFDEKALGPSGILRAPTANTRSIDNLFGRGLKGQLYTGRTSAAATVSRFAENFSNLGMKDSCTKVRSIRAMALVSWNKDLFIKTQYADGRICVIQGLQQQSADPLSGGPWL